MTVPFAELKRTYFALQPELDGAYRQVMERGHYIMGPELEAFEHEFAAYCGTPYGLGVGNGLDALILILKALGVGRGDEVIVSGHTYIASWLAITECGALPVPVPPAEGDLLINADAIEKYITPATKAIMPVHLYGQAVNMTKLCAVAAKHNIAVVEDSAQAQGAMHNGKMCGSFGVASGCSLYPGKNLGAYGDAGIITANDKAIYEKLKLLRNYGSPRKYVHEIQGVNSRLDELQAAFLRVKLRYLDKWNATRAHTAAKYESAFRGLNFLSLPTVPAGDVHVWHQYVLRTPYRDALQAHLKAQGVDTLIHYPTACHKHQAYSAYDFSKYDLSYCEKLAATVLSIPIDAFITDKEIESVISAVRSFKA